MVLCLVAFSGSNAHARRAGIQASSCSGCHGGAVEAEISVTLEPEQIEAGGTVSLVVTVGGEGTNAAGISIFGPEGGVFTVGAGEPLDVLDRYVTHTSPKQATNGEVQFHVDWQAPATPGLGTFEIAVLAANGDGRASGDRSSGQYAYIAYGCEPKTVYWDFDGDGIGREDSPLYTCDDPEGYAPEFGDCDDRSADVYPGAPELCNEADDDCDGEIDEHVVDILFYADADGDGYGDPRNMIEACTPPEGYVTNKDDCHDGTIDASPVAPEICDYIDNNCDSKIDEGVRSLCGVGLCVREADLCGETTVCTPGDPLEERCNGYDDDCDGETDEEGCPEGQECFENACVESGSVPAVSPGTTSTPTESVSPNTTDATDLTNEVDDGNDSDNAADETDTDGSDTTAGNTTTSPTTANDTDPDETDATEEDPEDEAAPADADEADDGPNAEVEDSSGGCNIQARTPSRPNVWWLAALSLSLVSLTTRRKTR